MSNPNLNLHLILTLKSSLNPEPFEPVKTSQNVLTLQIKCIFILTISLISAWMQNALVNDGKDHNMYSVKISDHFAAHYLRNKYEAIFENWLLLLKLTSNTVFA